MRSAEQAPIASAAPDGLSTARRRARRLREARGQAIVLGVVIWLVAGWLLSTPGAADRFGKVKGTDFAYFYVFGAVAREGQRDVLYDHARLHEIQAERVPASARDYFYSVYPPQVALVFAPLGVLPYLGAFAAWSALTIAGYLWVVRAAWTAHRSSLPGFGTITIFAVSFPPLWYLVLHGQSTLLVLLAFGLAGAALHRSRSFVAGLALGLLACKPQWVPVVGLVLLIRGEWRILAGMAVSAVAQAALVWSVLGVEPLVAYARLLPTLTGLPLAPKAYLMHSVAAWTNLLPRPVNQIVWIAAIVAIVIVAVRSWRRDAPPTARLGVLVVAAVLASPHLGIYDATVLALPFVWWAGLVERHASQWPVFYRFVTALWILYLLPTVLLIGVQLSVPVLGAMYWQSRRLASPRRQSLAAEP